jgi:alkyldihydroxyacetonephosphate synthase
LYFTFAGRPPAEERERYYRAVWDAGQRAVLDAGGALSHHHGVGLNRARFVEGALGAGFGVLQGVKDALDPNGILNPGKLGLRNPFGDLPWP